MRWVVAFLFLGVILTLPPPAALATAPWLELSATPAFPDYVENPGGEAALTITISLPEPEWGRVDVTLTGPGGVEVFRESYLGSSAIECRWTAVAGTENGFYRWNVVYDCPGFPASAHLDILVTDRSTGICGFKIIDMDADGVYDPDFDQLAAGWEICVHGLGGAPDLGCRVTEAEYGSTCWFFITPGTYQVCETLQSGYAPVTAICDTVTVASLQIVEVDFFNTPTGACCFYPSGECLTLTSGECLAQGGVYQGDFVACEPGLCPYTPTENRSWGKVKTIYR